VYQIRKYIASETIGGERRILAPRDAGVVFSPLATTLETHEKFCASGAVEKVVAE
jgi:hypothetical protein